MNFKSSYTKRNSRTSPNGFFASVKEIGFLLLVVFLIRTFIFSMYQVPSGSMETTMLVGERFVAEKLSYLFSKPKRNDIIVLNEPTYKYSSNPIVRLYQEYVGIVPFYTWGPANWTKRVIGAPGDHVQGVIEDGKPVIYLNGKKLDEPYINKYPLIFVLPADYKPGVALHPDWRSYDPSKPLSKQEFYVQTPGRVLREAQLNPEFIESMRPYIRITQEGYLLKEQNFPCEPTESRMENGNHNSWTGSDIFDVQLSSTQYWIMGDNRRGSCDSRYFGPVESRLIHAKIMYRIWSNDSNYSWWIVDLIFHPLDFFKHMRTERFFQRVK